MNINLKTCLCSPFTELYLIINLILLFFLSSCGADVKSSADVEQMFNNVKTIQNKMDVICSAISSDSNFDLSKHKIYGDAFCSEAPSDKVIDLNSVQSKEYTYGASDSGKEGDDYRFSIRIEVYANTGILEGAQKAIPTLKDLKDVNNADSQFSIATVEKLNLDETTMTASAKIELTSPLEKNGSGLIQNKWKIYGKKVDNYFVATVDTYEKTSKESLLNNAHFLAAIIPHAGDIYINLIGVFFLTSRGVDGAMEKALSTMVTDTLYDIRQKFN